MEGRLRQWEGGQDRLVGRPAHAAFLASLAEHLPPQPDDAVLEHAQGSIVEDHAVVPVVTPQDLAEPTMLLPHRGVHPMQHVLPDGLQLSHHALGLRLPFDHEPAAPGPSAVVREAQEVEGLRASLPGSCSSLGGEPPELDQPGLALVERQAELRQPVLERHEKLPRLCLVLAADHESSSGGDLHLDLHPSALSEPDVRLSPHPAPTLQPPAWNRKRLCLRHRLLPRWVAGLLGRSVGSLPSPGVPRLRRYYEPVRPCASHRYSAPQGSAPWRSP